MKSTPVAVLGSNGQVGRALLKSLAADERFRVIAVCRNEVSARLIHDCDAEIRIGPMTDEETAQRLLNGAEVIINCAWSASLPRRAEQENRQLVQFALAVPTLRRLIILSSVAVYGPYIPEHGCSFEAPRGATSYARAKLNWERESRALAAARPEVQLAVIRLGHVFGAKQWLSKLVLDLARTPAFTLPFDGERPSNAVHIDEVVRALVEHCLSERMPPLANLTGTPQHSWRDIFDWHTAATGLARVSSLSPSASLHLQQRLAASVTGGRYRRFLWELLRIAKTTGRSFLAECARTEAVRSLADDVLRRLPLAFEARMKTRHMVSAARRALQTENNVPPPLFFCHSVPGPALPIPGDAENHPSTDELSRQELREWYAQQLFPSERGLERAA